MVRAAAGWEAEPLESVRREALLVMERRTSKSCICRDHSGRRQTRERRKTHIARLCCRTLCAACIQFQARMAEVRELRAATVYIGHNDGTERRHSSSPSPSDTSCHKAEQPVGVEPMWHRAYAPSAACSGGRPRVFFCRLCLERERLPFRVGYILFTIEKP